MAADLGDLYARLRLDTGSLDAAVAKTHGLGATLGTAFVAAGVAAAASGAVIGTVAVKMAADFQTATTQIVTGAGESIKNIDLIRQGLLAMAPAIGASPQELAKALYYIESAGFHGAAGLEVLRAAAEGAKIGMADQQTVADAVTSALNAYSLGSGKAVQVTNDLIATEAAGKLHMQDLASAIGAVLAPAAALGVKLPEVSAAIATMTMQGTDANRATQSLRFIIAALTGPTAAATKEMQGLGVGLQEIPGITASATAEMHSLGLKSSEVAYTLSHQGLQAALEQVTEAIGKKFPAGSAEYNAALRNAVGGTRGFTAALELTGPHAATFQANIESITTAFNKGGTAVDNWSLIQQTFSQKLDQAKAGLDTLLITIGTALLPVLGAAVDWFSKLIGGLQGAAGASGPLQTAIHDVVDTLKTMGDWIADHIVPIFVTWASWMGEHVVPIIAQVAQWVREKLLPELGKLADTFNKDVYPALLGVSTAILDWVVKPLISIAETVIPPILQAIDWIGQHINQLMPIILTIGGAIAAIWAVNKIETWYLAASSALLRLGALSGVAGAGVTAGGAAAGGAAGAEGAAGAGLLARFATSGFALPTVVLTAGVVLGEIVTAMENDWRDTTYKSDLIHSAVASMVDPVDKMLSDFQTSAEATKTIDDAMLNAPRIALAIRDVSTSTGFTSLWTRQQSQLMEDLAKAIKNGTVKTPQDVRDFATAWENASNQSGTRILPDTKAVADALANLKKRWTDAMNKIISSFESAANTSASQAPIWNTLFHSITANLGTAAQQAARIIHDLGPQPAAPGSLSGGGNPWGVYSGQHPQFGGFVPPGQWAIMGEAGPEPVFGGRTGATVLPNESLHGGISVVNHFTLNGGDEALVQRVRTVVAQSLNDVLLAARS